MTSYFHKDHLGSTAAVTNEAGVKIESTTYEPFGFVRAHDGSEVSAYKFTDQELDNETNLYNYDARLYDPVIGMFITPDSIVPNMFDPQMLNRYAYCRNNPLIYVDPTGHKITGPNDTYEEKAWGDFWKGLDSTKSPNIQPPIDKSKLKGVKKGMVRTLEWHFGVGNVTQKMLDNYWDSLAVAKCLGLYHGKFTNSEVNDLLKNAAKEQGLDWEGFKTDMKIAIDFFYSDITKSSKTGINLTLSSGGVVAKTFDTVSFMDLVQFRELLVRSMGWKALMANYAVTFGTTAILTNSSLMVGITIGCIINNTYGKGTNVTFKEYYFGN